MSRSLRGLALCLCLLLIFATLPALAQVSQPGNPQGGSDVQQPQTGSAGNSVQPQPQPGRPRFRGVPWRDPNGPIILAAPAGAHLTYFGGPVISNVHVVQVLYGSGLYTPEVAGTTTPSMGTFFSDILGPGSGYISLLTQYNTPASGGTNQVIGNGTFDGLFQIVPAAANDGSTIDDSNIQAELLAQINAGHLPAPILDAAGNVNTLYMTYFPHGKTITQDGLSSCTSGGFCAYHGTTSNTLNSKHLLYGVLPDMQAGSGCDAGCGSASEFDNYTSVASHELTEAITDADVGIAPTFAAPLAWYDLTNGEIGDICDAQDGSYTANGTTYNIQLEFSNAANNCVLPPAAPTPDFTLSASPASLAVPQGSSGNSTIATTVTAGSAATVAFTVSGVPTGATATFSPASVTAGESTTLNVNAGNAVAGTYTLLITGTEGAQTHSISVALMVVANDFSITAVPSSLRLGQAAVGTSTILTTVTSGSAGLVAFAVSGVPSGAIATLSPTSITSGGSSTLTVNAGTALPGTYTLVVTGVEGTQTHLATITLTVLPPNDFSIFASPVNLVLTQGSSIAGSISTAVTSGSAGAIALTVSGVPNGATVTFSPASLIAGGSSTFTVNAGLAVAGAYVLVVTGVEGTITHSATIVLTIVSVIVNGDFETGDLTGWSIQGTAAVIPGGHAGNFAAQVGGTSPTKGNSYISQSFMVPAAGGLLSFWYQVHCPDTLTFDWAVARIKDTATGVTSTVLPRTCTNNGLWVRAVTDLSASASHIVTLTLESHDDNFPGDATYTLYDDVGLGPPPPPLQNRSFETGDLTGWSSSGTVAVVSGGHAGNFAALLGSTSPTNGDSSISQTFTAPVGATQLSVWFWETCPDTVVFDWARATLKDNTTGTTTVAIPRQCQTTNGWVEATVGLVGGHVYTLTLINHDDNFPGDPTYTLYDDIVIQ